MAGRDTPPDSASPPEGAPPPRPIRGLTGAVVRGVRQPARHEVVLETYDPRTGAAHWLFSAHPDYPRFGRAFVREKNPPRPPVFCQWLRARLIGATVGALEIPCGGVLVLPARRGQMDFRLVLESNGADSNLLLLDGDSRLLIALRHPALPGRRLTAGETYLPPQRLRNLPPDAPREAMPPESESEARALDKAWRERERKAAFVRRRQYLLRRIRTIVKRIARRTAHQEADLERAREAESHRRRGELLKIHRHRIRPGESVLVAADEFDPARPEVEIPLDPLASPAENIERHFRRYRKLRDAAPHIRRRLGESEAERGAWDAIAAALADAADGAALERIEAGWSRAQRALLAPPRSGVKEADRPREVMTRYSSDGYEILVGRSKIENDRVTFRLGRGNDWWFHAQGIPGSHVVVRAPGGKTPPPDTVAEAAWLAAYYSRRREEGGLEVDYTQRKHVRKIKGAEPGQVTYSRNRTIWVDLSGAARRILAADDPAGAVHGGEED